MLYSDSSSPLTLANQALVAAANSLRATRLSSARVRGGGALNAGASIGSSASSTPPRAGSYDSIGPLTGNPALDAAAAARSASNYQSPVGPPPILSASLAAASPGAPSSSAPSSASLGSTPTSTPMDASTTSSSPTNVTNTAPTSSTPASAVPSTPAAPATTAQPPSPAVSASSTSGATAPAAAPVNQQPMPQAPVFTNPHEAALAYNKFRAQVRYIKTVHPEIPDQAAIIAASMTLGMAPPIPSSEPTSVSSDFSPSPISSASAKAAGDRYTKSRRKKPAKAA